MAVFRVHKIENYTTIDNNIFKNKNLSYKAKGLLCTMLSLNDNWEFSIKGLSKLSTDETRSTEAGLKELKNNGYLKVTKISPHNNCNKITYAYDVYEEPQGVQIVGVQNEGVQVVGVQNVAQLNNNNKISNNKITNNNKKNISKDIFQKVEDKNLREAFKEYNKSRKVKLTERSLSLCLKELNEWYPNNVAKQIECIEQSIMNGWRGLFKLKEKKKTLDEILDEL